MKDETKKLIALGGVGAVAIYMLRPKATDAGGFGGGGGAPLLPILPEETTEKAGDIIYNLPAAVETAFTGFGADVKESIAEGDITPSKKDVSKVTLKAEAVGDTDTITQRLEKFLLPGETIEGFLETSIAASQTYPVSKKGHEVASLYFKGGSAGLKDPSVVSRAVTTTRKAAKVSKKAAGSSGRYWRMTGEATHSPGWKQMGAREPTAPGQPDIY